MAHIFKYTCKKCGLNITTSGPHECMIHKENNKKNIKKLPHPCTAIANGLVVNGYCLSCDKNVDIIISEFKRAGDPWEQELTNIKDEYHSNYSYFIKENPKKKTVFTECFNYSSLICPDCQKEILFHPSRNIICPNCKENELQVSEFLT